MNASETRLESMTGMDDDFRGDAEWQRCRAEAWRIDAEYWNSMYRTEQRFSKATKAIHDYYTPRLTALACAGTGCLGILFGMIVGAMIVLANN